MPWDRKKYPSNWGELRAAVQKRAGNCCEGCGVPNRVWITRDAQGNYWPPKGESTEDDLRQAVKAAGVDGTEDYRAVHVVCTTAHVNHNLSDNRLENLKFWCQQCHNRHDAPYRAKNATRTKANKKRQAEQELGQMSLELGV